jgi:hypothetical protein
LRPIYTHITLRRTTINGIYVVDVLSRFWKNLLLKRPEKMSQEWFFHWDNAPVHTTSS